MTLSVGLILLRSVGKVYGNVARPWFYLIKNFSGALAFRVSCFFTLVQIKTAEQLKSLFQSITGNPRALYIKAYTEHEMFFESSRSTFHFLQHVFAVVYEIREE